MDYISGWCKSKRSLDNVTAIVTGCNTGIGKETVRDFYNRGAKIIMACRDIGKAEAAKKEIETNNKSTGVIVIEKLDLSSLQSVRDFAGRILDTEESIHILVNNAGIMCVPQGKTEDGFESHIGTNHFGHALLTLLLLPRLLRSAPARVVNVSSLLHADSDVDLDDVNYETPPYKPTTAYSRSKCANVLFTRALANKLKEHSIKNVTTYSLHPGVIPTDIGRHFDDAIWYGASWAFRNILGWFTKSPRCGAQTSIYCAIDETCANESGLYYSDCAPRKPSSFCQNDEAAAKFWDITIESLQLGGYEPFAKI